MKNSRFDLKKYTEPKTEEERRILARHGYRTLPLDEAMKFAETMGQLVAGDATVEVLPDHLKDGSVEIRYYTKNGSATLGKEGEDFYVFFKEANVALPISIQNPGSRLKHEKI